MQPSGPQFFPKGFRPPHGRSTTPSSSINAKARTPSSLPWGPSKSPLEKLDIRRVATFDIKNAIGMAAARESRGATLNFVRISTREPYARNPMCWSLRNTSPIQNGLQIGDDDGELGKRGRAFCRPRPAFATHHDRLQGDDPYSSNPAYILTPRMLHSGSYGSPHPVAGPSQPGQPR